MKWKKLGRIFFPESNIGWMKTHASVPIAYLLENGLIRIYFSSRDRVNQSQVGYIVIDIRNPSRVLEASDSPVLAKGKAGYFDDSGAMASWIVNDGHLMYMYYIGWNLGISVPFRNAMGLAVSNDDGLTFSKVSEGPILDRSVYDPCLVASCCVLLEHEQWRMWYLSGLRWEINNGSAKHYYHIKYAESTDGFDWKRSGIVCLDFNTGDEHAISRPCVVRDEDKYRMWYSYRGNLYRIGYAESDDGLSWQRRDEEVGIDVSLDGWDSEMIEYPFVFDFDGNRYMLYNGNDYGRTGIGLAVLTV